MINICKSIKTFDTNISFLSHQINAIFYECDDEKIKGRGTKFEKFDLR